MQKWCTSALVLGRPVAKASCIGGARELVDAFLAHPDPRRRVREVDPSVEDATLPGHTAF